MKLSVAERLTLLQSVFPDEGSFLTLKIVREAREALSFSSKEAKALDFKTDNGQIGWKNGAVKEKVVPLSSGAVHLIRKALFILDEKQQLTVPQMSLYEKFVEVPEWSLSEKS